MKAALAWITVVGWLVNSTFAQEQPAPNDPPKGDSWTRSLKDRSKRGTLHDAFQKVRGDSGKWNDEARLQVAPPITLKPPKLPLDDWADQLEDKPRPAKNGEDHWLLFKTRQLDDNDRVWIETIEREGREIRITMSEAIWQGRYMKTFTFYHVYGVNLGPIPPGDYTVKWTIKPLEFRMFEGSGRPVEQQSQKENWPKDEKAADEPGEVLTLEFTVPESAT
jgi:hypothetical protein